jgi:hypothetical protein
MRAHPTGHFNSAGFGHLDIQHGDIGFVFLDERLSLFAISRLSNDLEVVRAFKQLTHPRADDVMIVSQKNADFGF